MQFFKKIYFLIFPILIIVIQLITYKAFNYNPNTVNILITVSLAYLLSPRVKTFENQNGKQAQVTWLFLKKSFIE